MNRYNNPKSRVAQQAVKPSANPSESPRPVYRAAGAAQPPVQRHRRSDRHKTPEEKMEESVRREAPQASQTAQEPQWVRRQPPQEPWDQGEQTGRSSAYADENFMRRPVRLEEEEYDDEEDQPRRWPRILLIILLALVVFCAALYFVPDAGPLQKAKEFVTGAVASVKNLVNPQPKVPAQALSFQAVSNAGQVDSYLQFHLTTTKTVEGVRLEDSQGQEIPCTVSLVNGEDETNKIWAISAIFDAPYEGEIYAAIKEGDVWTRTDKWVPMSIQTPVPTETPAPT